MIPYSRSAPGIPRIVQTPPVIRLIPIPVTISLARQKTLKKYINKRPAAPRPIMDKSAAGLFFMYAIKYPAKQAAQKIRRILFCDSSP